jgi:FAD/FMN-containing dehydrogenase
MEENQTNRENQPASGIGRQSEYYDRVLSAPVLRFDLEAQLARLRRQGSYKRGAPTGKTLVKEPDLRIVVMALRSGGRLAQSGGHPLIPHGSGYSYGDTALNAENIVLDMSRMTCVLRWDPADSPV